MTPLRLPRSIQVCPFLQTLPNTLNLSRIQRPLEVGPANDDPGQNRPKTDPGKADISFPFLVNPLYHKQIIGILPLNQTHTVLMVCAFLLPATKTTTCS